MTSIYDGLQIEWLVACLSPRDVAPHPNFRTDSATGAELLALIVQFSWQEYATYRDLTAEEAEASSSTSMTEGLLDAARRALDSDTIQEGLDGLVLAAKDEHLSLGSRATAALLAAVVSSELDEPEAQLDVLSHVASLFENSQVGSLASRRLAVAVLLQQRAFRELEAGRVNEARTSAQRVISTLADIGGEWDEFPVSRGISWSASDSQARLVELIDGNARWLLLSIGDHLDQSWTALVRAPFPAAAVRQTRDTLTALTSVIDDVFKQSYPSTRLVRTFGKDDATLRLLYASMLHAELTGDMANVARLRETLGSVFSIRLTNDSSNSAWYTEATRLLRQGDAGDHLRRLLQVIRMQGPLDGLRLAAEKLIATRARQNFITSTDLVLLDRAADLISDSFTDRAVGLALKYASQGRDGRVKGTRVIEWKRVETSLRTTSALVAGNHQTDMVRVASSVLELIGTPKSAGDQFVFRALAQLSSEITWDAVPSATRKDWLLLLDSAARSPDVLTIDLLRAYAAMGRSEGDSLRHRLAQHEFVAALIGGLLGDPPAINDLDKAVEVILETIEVIRRDAAQGKFSRYSWSPLVMAANLITDFARADVWPVLLGVLSDPKVPNEEKVNALRALTADARRVVLPDQVRESLTARNVALASDQEDVFFSVPADQVDAAHRNFLLAYGAVTLDEVRTSVLSQVGSRDLTLRSEAAESCFLAAARSPLVEWPQILLLQLSHDHESLVRNRASRGLAYLSALPQAVLANSVRERVSSLLNEPGIAMTMGALHGLASAVRDSVPVNRSLWCGEIVQLLAREHPSRNIRSAAQAVLELY